MIKFKQGWRPKAPEILALKPVLQGGRVILRPHCAADYAEWVAVRAKNRDFLTPFEPAWAKDCLTEPFFKRRLERQSREWHAGRGAFFLVRHRDTGDLIGGVNLNNIYLGALRHASLGYWIDQEYQGQGYMREACQLAIDYAFDVLKLRRINAACLPKNIRSVNLLGRLGFDDEGYAKKYFQINGRWQDHRLFGLVNDM